MISMEINKREHLWKINAAANELDNVLYEYANGMINTQVALQRIQHIPFIEYHSPNTNAQDLLKRPPTVHTK